MHLGFLVVLNFHYQEKMLTQEFYVTDKMLVVGKLIG